MSTNILRILAKIVIAGVLQQHDAGNPNDLLPRLELLQRTYQALVEHDLKNKVLGEPKDYFKLYQRSDWSVWHYKTIHIPTANARSVDDPSR